MKIFIIICMLIIVGFTVYTYKIILDIAKHMEETLVQHDIELAKVHYCLKENINNDSQGIFKEDG